jgi:Ser-tRNA(Ala) deacylase AlaX
MRKWNRQGLLVYLYPQKRYLDNSHLCTADSEIIDCGVDDKGNYVILNKTIFHPQGGGQPSDVGTIELNGVIFLVTSVAYDNATKLSRVQIIKHYGNKAEADLFCNGMDLTTYPEYMRVVKVGDIFIPCGGTHINSTSEIGLDSWTIHKIKKKKKMLRVGYSISDK